MLSTDRRPRAAGVALAIGVAFASASLARADEAALAKDLADVTAAGGRIEWSLRAASDGAVLTVLGPSGEVERYEVPAGERPVFLATDAQGKLRPDGTYVWELRPVHKPLRASREVASGQSEDANGRTGAEAGRAAVGAGDPLSQSGSFLIRGGAILSGGSREPLAGTSKSAGAPREVSTATPPGREVLDQVIADDLIVQGSGCFGIDCVNNENFGFDTIRAKENNTRIQFDDTSTSAGFPTNNWQIRANSSASGGANFLAFVDQGATGNSETGTILFQVDAGAPANSLLVSSSGRVGFRTATPVLDLHVNTSNTPGLRLEQNSSGGFTAQTWDIGGNEANFFVRDVTGGSRYPFRIRPGAPTSSIDISASGAVGIGTASPDPTSALHVVRTAASSSDLVIYENNGPSRYTMTNNTITNGGANSKKWTFNSNGNLRITVDPALAVTPRLTLDAMGNLAIVGTLTTGGGGHVPDFVFEPGYRLRPLEEVKAFVECERHLPDIPSGIEIARNGVNMTEMQFKLLQKVEELTLYTLRQDETIKALEKKIEALEKARN